MKALGERTVILDCDVLQADGGTRTAAITGASVALALALGKLVAAGTLKTSPLRQMLAATSVGIVDGNILLDLAYEEDSRADVDMNVVMLADGGLVETQATAERVSYTRAQLTAMLDLRRKRHPRTTRRNRQHRPPLKCRHSAQPESLYWFCLKRRNPDRDPERAEGESNGASGGPPAFVFRKVIMRRSRRACPEPVEGTCFSHLCLSSPKGICFFRTCHPHFLKELSPRLKHSPVGG
jgi:hypothetical protein